MPQAIAPAFNTPLRLAYQPPYHIEALLKFLSDRAIAGVEQVDPVGARILRSVQGRDAVGQSYHGWIQLSFKPAEHAVEFQCSEGLFMHRALLVPAVRRWLDLDAQPQAIMANLGPLAKIAPGLRLAGCMDRFELAVRAVLGQQVTVLAARTLGHRFVQAFGQPLDEALPPAWASVAPLRLFPEPTAIAVLDPSCIAALGIIRQRADCLVSLAQRWPQLRYSQTELCSAAEPDAQTLSLALQELQTVKGIGPWTAHYMLMRGWSWPDAFPPKDVVLLRQLSVAQAGPLSAKDYLQAAQAYRPYRSYAVLSLWRAAALGIEALAGHDD
ncbi:AlkA N-terminal domain-containing protein [Roseateles koreensis]|uniref:DNA-3-methyladenine glycosylase II n=1 Tax=Roseateles koreensis TaxID=2987526 RepID=A0ABT5KNF6_9BURK|nr:AlkA N-terminal domain-containing protein [Roseateles koreensis]MDC8784444.1 AlkA N-terminal domain-containing protein [Roseateles koreensis]